MRKLLCCLVLLVPMSLARAACAADDVPRGQLPATVAPTHYALDLTIVPREERFTGVVRIDVTVAEPTARIWLHGQDLTVDSVVVDDGEALAGSWHEIPASEGVSRIDLPRPIKAGQAKIEIRYSAAFNRKLEGLYRADEGGERYVFSQMEPIWARLAFPGFDEPRFKTPFDVVLTVPASDSVIANTPEIDATPVDGGLKRVRFATTKPLPTYLVAMAVGPFDVVTAPPIPKTAVRDRVVPLRGIAVKGKGPQLRYALSVTPGLLLALEDYFGIPYPYEKLDLIGALDFSEGAMENAGAIVYRESLLLYPETAGIPERRRFALVNAHEMAHQWFGDLVTPKWWNDIWLNESFATWMEAHAAAAWDPKGEYERQILNGGLGAMSLDSWRSARRIAEPIRSNGDIYNAFDGITYEKGAAVLAMFEHYLGAEAFRKGVQLYLRRHAWGTATADDFLAALSEASGTPAGAGAFRSFLDQAGVPIVRGELQCGRRGAALEVRQTRYLQRPPVLGLGPVPGLRIDMTSSGPIGDQTWRIPVCASYPNGTTRADACTLVDSRKGKVALGDRCPAWVMPNADGAGYYRFTLPRESWDALIAGRNALRDTEVLAALDSLDAGFTSGMIGAEDYLPRVVALLHRDRGASLPVAYDVAGSPVGRLRWIRDVLAPPDLRPKVEQLIRNTYGPWAQRLGLVPSPAVDGPEPAAAALLRPVVINADAIQGRDPALRQQLVERGRRYLGLTDGDGRLHPDAVDDALVVTALTVTVQDGGAAVIGPILALLQSERSGLMRQRLLQALTRATDPAAVAMVRELALNPAIRVNEVPMIVFGAFGEPPNTGAAWAWFKQNFAALAARVPPDERVGLPGVGGTFCSAKERDDYRAFFKAHMETVSGGARVIATTLEQIDACIGIKAYQQPRLAKALAAVLEH